MYKQDFALNNHQETLTGNTRRPGNNGKKMGGARGVMVIVVGNGHDDTSSNPGRDWLHFT